MNRYVPSLLILLTSVLLTGQGAWAQEDEGYGLRKYLTLAVGSYQPEHRTSSLGTGIEVGIGIAPIPFLALETNVGYLQNKVDDFGFMGISITETAKAIYPLGPVSIYGLAGGGYYFLTYHFDGNHNGQNFPTSDDDTKLGHFYGGGLNLHFTPSITLGSEIKWLNLKANFNKLQNSSLSAFGSRDYTGALFLARLAFNF